MGYLVDWLPIAYSPMNRLCSECGEPISQKRLDVMPATQLCFECASVTAGAGAIAPPKVIESKPIATTFHLKRYLSNVGQKADAKALFRTLVRVNYLFPHVTAAEMTVVIIQWSKQTHSSFDQSQIRQLVLDAKQWVQAHPDQRK
jgi:hypothetical protein